MWLSSFFSTLQSVVTLIRSRILTLALFVASAYLIISCEKQPIGDGCCDLLPLSADADSHGVLHVAGSTSATYTAISAEGVEYGPTFLNEPLILPEGHYTVHTGASSHSVNIVAGMETRCATGTLVISGNAPDTYSVADTVGRTVSQRINRALSLFPGTYRVVVNRTTTWANVSPGQWTKVRTGTLLVKGGTRENYYVLDNDNHQLVDNTLGRPAALMPGKYTVKVNNTSLGVEVVAGQIHEYATGSVLVRGLTDEFYYVTDTLSRKLNYRPLNQPLALFPGSYVATINNSAQRIEVVPDSTLTFETGTLVLTGAGQEYFSVIDPAGRELHSSTFNRPVSLFPADYTVKLGNTLRNTTVNPRTNTSLEAFH